MMHNNDSADGAPLSRRVVMKLSGGALLTAWLPLTGCGTSNAPTASGSEPAPTPRAQFLTEPERRTLDALVDRMIPPDTDAGAAQAGCGEAIDALLAAFLTDPPFIYAGAPFSDRGGAPNNDFLEFLPLDAYEATAWRLTIEGSRGDPALEFNGPIRGLQQIYRDGLARLDTRAGGLVTGTLPSAIGDGVSETPLSELVAMVDGLTGNEGFAELPVALQEVILRDPSDPVVQELVDVAFPGTLDAMYGPPEYGGNRGLVGWTFTEFDGDTQPTGYTDSEVVQPDNPGVLDSLLPPSYGAEGEQARTRRRQATTDSRAAESKLWLSAAAGESVAGAVMHAQGSLQRLRQRLEPLARSAEVMREIKRDA